MRRTLLMLFVLLTAWTVVPVASAIAQSRGGGGGGGDDEDSDAKKKKSKEEWELRQAPLPGKKNAGPCPFVKVLYDAARYAQFKDNHEASNAVQYTGEIQGLSADCTYKGVEPISVKLDVRFAFGRGPEAPSAHKSYSYWVAVTHRNREVLAKEYFSVPVNFPSGQDRVGMVDHIKTITIPRRDNSVSGENFEILVGFDVTPEMADFNREGKRFRVNAGAPAVAEAKSGGPGGR
jgi:hypothetical protein